MDLKKKQAWEVSTEGDIEGRSLKVLGVYWGTFVEVVVALGGKQCYQLMMTLVDKKESECLELPVPIKYPDEIHVSSTHQNKDVFLDLVKSQCETYNFSMSNYYNAIKLSVSQRVNRSKEARSIDSYKE